MPQTIIFSAIAAYASLLFLIAWAFDNRPSTSGEAKGGAVIYGLSLAVYCTSWTFYGAVGTAVDRGWEYLPIYLGPAIMFSFGLPVVRRLVERGSEIGSTSISDFISYHYGKSQGIAALISLFAVIGALPYIALQLTSVTSTYQVLTGGAEAQGVGATIAVALLLCVFAILFGTRHLDVTRSNRGMIAAVAVDSIVKLVALLAVAAFAVSLSLSSTEAAPVFEGFGGASGFSLDRFMTLTILSIAAALCLPRQFQVTVVENLDPRHVRSGSRLFLAYLLLIAIAAPPIAAVGADMLQGQPADLYVLSLPLAAGADWLALLVFIGGFAAATGMVIVASVALSTMVTNDLIAPVFLQTDMRSSASTHLGKRLLFTRRIVICAVLGGAALFAIAAPQADGLASFGILSFAAAAQFAPALLGSLYWKGADPAAAAIGLLAGAVLWAVLLLAPSLQMDGAAMAAPLNLDPLTIGVAGSLGLNAALFVGISLFRSQPAPQAAEPQIGQSVTSGDLYFLIERCLGQEDATAAITAFEQDRGRRLDPARPADTTLIAFTDGQISRAIGASSASILLKSALAGDGLNVADVATLLGETSEKVSFSQELLQTALENIKHGVSVVDRDLRLVAWNKVYADLYDYPAGLLEEGRPVADLIRFNAARGECGDGDIDQQVTRRLAHLKAGSAHSFERTRTDGQVIRIEGKRSPSGAYVTTYTDVTEYQRVVKALRNSERSIRFYTDNVPAMIAFADVSQTLHFANDAYRRQFDIADNQIGQAKLRDVMGADIYAARKPFIDRALKGERVIFDVDARTEGQDHFMQVTYVPQRTSAGDVRGFFGMYQDVTARRAAEEALAAANETLEERVATRTRELERLNTALDAARRQAEEATASKTRFLAAASHDVLQPLNAARLFASALKDAGDTERHDLTDKIDASIASADDLLRALLNISKFDAGGIAPSITSFPLQPLFHQLLGDISPSADEKGLRISIAPTTLFVESDRGLIYSALQNLASNGVKHTREGRVLIGARRIGDSVRIDVLDTGPGIQKRDQADIFKEFRQLKGAENGAGLGLATVDRISRLLDLKVSVQSEVGRGSCFSLNVRRAAQVSAPSDSTPPRTRTPPRHLDGVKVICIDNDAMVADATAAALSRWGATAIAAGSAQEALERSPGNAPDLLVLDYQLDDDLTGFDALDSLSASWGVRPPALMITASSSTAAEAHARAIGMPILRKPVEPAELRAAIDALRRQAAR